MQPHRPIANVYDSIRPKYVEEKPHIENMEEIIEDVEFPANLIELKMELNMVLTRIRSLDFKRLDLLSQEQILNLWQTLHDEMEQSMRLMNYLNELGKQNARRLK